MYYIINYFTVLALSQLNIQNDGKRQYTAMN